ARGEVDAVEVRVAEQLALEREDLRSVRRLHEAIERSLRARERRVDLRVRVEDAEETAGRVGEDADFGLDASAVERDLRGRLRARHRHARVDEERVAVLRRRETRQRVADGRQLELHALRIDGHEVELRSGGGGNLA